MIAKSPPSSIRKFTSPGYTYNLILTSRNMHAVNSTDIVIIWSILCANPVKPEHWSLGYSPNQYYGEPARGG